MSEDPIRHTWDECELWQTLMCNQGVTVVVLWWFLKEKNVKIALNVSVHRCEPFSTEREDHEVGSVLLCWSSGEETNTKKAFHRRVYVFRQLIWAWDLMSLRVVFILWLKMDEPLHCRNEKGNTDLLGEDKNEGNWKTLAFFQRSDIWYLSLLPIKPGIAETIINAIGGLTKNRFS